MNSQSQSSALERRVNQLEKQGRLMKLLLFGLPVIVLILGADANDDTKNQKNVICESLVVASPDGKGTASLTMIDGSPQFVLTDKEGRPRVNLAGDAKDNGPGLWLVDENKESIAALFTSKNSGRLVLSRGKHPLVIVSEADVSNGYGTINFYDGKGNWKQALGGGNLK